MAWGLQGSPTCGTLQMEHPVTETGRALSAKQAQIWLSFDIVLI